MHVHTYVYKHIYSIILCKYFKHNSQHCVATDIHTYIHACLQALLAALPENRVHLHNLSAYGHSEYVHICTYIHTYMYIHMYIGVTTGSAYVATLLKVTLNERPFVPAVLQVIAPVTGRILSTTNINIYNKVRYISQ